MTGWNLPPGCTDRDIDEAARGPDVQCDNCGHMFNPDEDDDCFIGWHRSYGDCCQCGECIRAAATNANFPFSGSF